VSFWNTVGNFLGDVFTGGAYSQNQTNQAIANQNIAFQQKENAITRQREDNAVQRAALDMQAAGLSKTLAAGNPASAQALTAPQNTYKPSKIDIVGGALSLKNQAEQIRQQIAQTDLVKSQAKGQQIANEFDLENNKTMLKLNELKIDSSLAETRAKNASAALDEIKGKNYGDYIRAEIRKLEADTDLSIQEKAYKVAQICHLSKEDEKIVQDMLESQSRVKMYEHDLSVAQAGSTRTSGDSLTWWERAIRRFNIANGNQSINIAPFTAESLGYDW